jgi:cytochrome bd-type quinol oxidase subunit 1
MSDLLAARSQMAMSLAFHIVFAVAGMAMPALMVAAEIALAAHPRSRCYLDLTRRWAKGTAILFAVGAVSGTVLSFELGLLWPRVHGAGRSGDRHAVLARRASPSSPRRSSSASTFTAGSDRPPRAHLAAGWWWRSPAPLSAVFVVCANAWMNTPVGFRVAAGSGAAVWSGIDPLARACGARRRRRRRCTWCSPPMPRWGSPWRACTPRCCCAIRRPLPPRRAGGGAVGRRAGGAAAAALRRPPGGDARALGSR